MKNLITTAAGIAGMFLALVGLVWWAVPAEAQPVFGGATRSFHGAISCVTGGANISLSGAREITFFNPTADIVYVYSNNGAAANLGMPICDAGTCVAPSVKIPSGSGVFKCAGASVTVDAGVLGIQ